MIRQRNPMVAWVILGLLLCGAVVLLGGIAAITILARHL